MDTFTQKSINHCLNMVAPLEISDELIENEKWQFYHFMVSIYKGMYDAPEKYLVFPKPYEIYLEKEKNRIKNSQKQHVTDSKESTLRNTIQQAIQFYAAYLYHLGLKNIGIEDRTKAMVVPKKDYLDVLDKMKRFHDSKYNEERYEVLSKLGILTYENEENIYIIHKTYTNAMLGLQYLCAAPDSKYKWMNYLRLDYNNAYSPIPTVDDICKTLPSKSAKVVELLEDNLVKLKTKTKIKPLRGIVSDFKWKVEYVLKGKNICGFYADNEYFMLCIYFNNSQNISEFANHLKQEDYNLYHWFQSKFPERLCKCPSNRIVHLGEENRHICGLSSRAEIVNPTDDDVEKSIKILMKFRNI